MTMQIAIRANDGFVLASDLSVRSSDSYGSPLYTSAASYAKYESKIHLNKKHSIGFAIGGATPTGADVLSDFDADLSNETSPLDNTQWLKDWAAAYAVRYPTIRTSLLIVAPSLDSNAISELWIERDSSRLICDKRYKLSPDSSNPSNFWPQYCRAQDKPSLDVATRIAALTILMAGQLSPQGISGLEILQYRQEWNMLGDAEIEALQQEFNQIRRAIGLFLRRD